MKKLLKSGFIAAMITLMSASANAQVPDQWAYTLQLDGYWSGPATLNLGGQIFQINYHTNFNTILDGVGMTMDEGFADPAIGELKGANLIGLNAPDGLIHWSSVDNFGTAHEHIGSWTSSTHFYMEHHSLQGGQAYAEFIDVTLRSNNRSVFLTLIATLDADTVETLTGTLTHRGHNSHRVSNANADNDQLNGFSIFPNPSDGKITIEGPENISEVEITNETGQVVCKARPDANDFSIQLDAAGIYFVRVTSENKTETHKVILTK